MGRVVFITGTDTGVGKTVLTAWLTRSLRHDGVDVRAVKPLCSGGRADARALRRALGDGTSLEEINPWHFRAPLTPLLAARLAGLRVARRPVLQFLRGARRNCEVLLVEGAGGLLSPLGVGFDARHLIAALRASPVIVAPNRLGVLNQVLLTWEALPENERSLAKVALVAPPRATRVSQSNRGLLRERLGDDHVVEIPFLSHRSVPAAPSGWPRRLLQALGELVKST